MNEIDPYSKINWKDLYKDCQKFNPEDFENDIAYPKLLKRLNEGLCLGCGKKECTCKSKKGI